MGMLMPQRKVSMNHFYFSKIALAFFLCLSLLLLLQATYILTCSPSVTAMGSLLELLALMGSLVGIEKMNIMLFQIF